MGMFGFGSLLPGWGSIIGGAISAYGAHKSNQDTKGYLTGMSNTAHQRQIADLKKAGLNPILAARQGASTPSYQASNIGAAYNQGYQAYSSAKQAQAQTRNIETSTSIRQRDLEYLTKSGLSETQLKSKVKELIGHKSMTYIENALSGNTEIIPMPYRAPIQTLMIGLREAGLISGGTGGNIMFKSVDLDGAKEVAKSIAAYLAKTKTLEGVMGQ